MPDVLSSHSPPPTSELVVIFIAFVFASLVFTLLLELPIFYLLGFKKRKMLLRAVLVNVITVPIYQILNNVLIGALDQGIGLLVAEIGIIALESALLVLFLKNILKVKKIITATVLANAASFITGWVLLRIF